MAVRNYTTGKTKINFSINTCPPKMTDDEYNARAGKFNKFIDDVADIVEKYNADVTPRQARNIKLTLINLTAPFQFGYLNFSPDEVLDRIDIGNPDLILPTLKAFRDTYQEQKDSLEQDF